MIFLAAAVVATGAAFGPAFGQAPPAKQPAAKGGEAPDPKQAKAAAIAAAQRAYETGTKAFEAGKHKDAVAQLSSALAGGGLPSPQMAKALYYRGVANRKLAKPAQAMSDLTTAIWVSGGLSDADRAAAIENRQAAYREAGLGDQAPADINPDPVASTGKATAPVAVSPPVASPAAPALSVVAAAPASVPDAAPLSTAAAPEVALVAPPVKVAQQDNSGVPNPFGEPPASSAKAAPSLAALPAEPAPAAADPGGPTVLEKAGSSIAEASSNVGNFFGNMFKSSPSTAAPAPGQTAAVSPSALPPQAGPELQTSASPVLTAANPDGTVTSPAADWGQSTKTTAAKGAKIATAAPPPRPAANPVSTGAITPAVPPAPKALTGKYQLQIAAVRSRSEAEALAQKVKQQHGAALAGREPIVDETVIGNFGNFHRVRVGPYADAKEPGKFCSTLIKTGFDCLVVTQ